VDRKARAVLIFRRECPNSDSTGRGDAYASPPRLAPILETPPRPRAPALPNAVDAERTAPQE